MVENQFIKRVLVRKNTANSAPEIIYETADNKLIEHKGMELLPMSGYMISDIYEELSNHVLIDLLVSIHNESVLDVLIQNMLYIQLVMLILKVVS